MSAVVLLYLQMASSSVWMVSWVMLSRSWTGSGNAKDVTILGGVLSRESGNEAVFRPWRGSLQVMKRVTGVPEVLE